MSNQLLMRRRTMIVSTKRIDYLKHLSNEDGCTVTPTRISNSFAFPNLEYSVNKGIWNTLAQGDIINLDNGDIVEWRCPEGTSNTSVNIKFVTSGNILCNGMPTTLLVNDGILTKINRQAFKGTFVSNNNLICNLIIPEGVNIIGSGAFEDCTGIKDIKLPSSITTIGDTNDNSYNGPFKNCTGLTSVYFNGTIEQWEDIDFMGGPWHSTEVNPLSYAHNLYIDNMLITSVYFKENPKKHIFTGATCITNVFLNDNITEIGPCAFYNCTNLTSITLPSSLVKIDYRAFANCVKMDFPIFHEGLISIDWQAFSGLNKKSGTLVIPNSVTIIGDGAFNDFADWGSVHLVLGTGLTTIPNAFGMRFSGTLRIPSGVTSIAGNFMRANQISRVYIADTVTSIGNAAFFAYSVSEVRIALLHTTVPATDFSFLVYNTNNYKLYVPYSTDHSIIEAYKTAWSNISNNIYELDENGEIPS